MRTHPPRPNLALALACLLTILLFFLGIAAPQAHLWGSYLLPIMIVFLWGSHYSWRRDIYIVTALSSVLVVTTFWTDGATSLEDLLVNHLLPLTILWAAAWLLARQRQLFLQLAHREQALDAQMKARTAALGSKEEELAKIFRANPGGIAITRQADGICMDANDAYLAIVGYSRAELVGRSLVDLGIMPAATRDQVRAALRAQGAIRGLDLQIFNARGEPVDILYSLEQIDFDGEPCYLGLVFDVTANKKLAAHATRLAAIVEASHEAIISAHIDGTVIFVNHSAEELYGVSAAEAVGRNIADIALPQNIAGFDQMLGRIGAGEVVTVDDGSWQLSDGTARVLSVSVSPIRDEAGRVTAFTALARDVTKRKQLEDALRQSEQKWRSVFEFLPVGVSVVDGKDQVTDTNATLAQILHMTPEGILQGVYARRRYFHPDLSPLLPSEFPSQVALREGRILRDIVIGVETEDGETIWVSVSATPASLDGYAVTVTADITDLKRYQQLLQDTNAMLEQRVAQRTADLESALAELQRANRLKDEFLAMISHELRTPLMGVLSMSEMLEEQVAGPLNDRQVTYVAGITASGERLLNVVNGVLSYTHLLSGKVHFDAQPCELAGLLEICAVSQQHKAAAKNQAIAVQVAPPDLTITADATALADVLKRLLDNAVKFTPQGGQIGLEAHPGTVPGTVELAVWDTGIGIPAAQFDHILKPFTQSDGRLARSHEGTGLGLAYVDQMVRLMGGTLGVASTPGKGSRFTVTLRG